MEENEYDFQTLHIKISLYFSFQADLRKKINSFLTVQGENKGEYKEIW